MEHRARLQRLIQFFEARGYYVQNAHRDEDWGHNLRSPEECTRVAFNAVRLCDAFVALPGTPWSPGTHIEIGWATAHQKPVFLLLEKGCEYAALVEGILAFPTIAAIRFGHEREYFCWLASRFPR